MTHYSNEIWRDLPGYEGFYKVSDAGNVISCSRRVATGSGSKRRFINLREKVLKPVYNKGYGYIHLRKNNITKRLGVHQIVMHAFVGPQLPNIEVRHLDGCPSNNNLNNLAYGTKSDNMKDAIKHGRFPLGVMRPGAKLTPDIARKIAAHRGRICDIAKEFSIKSTSVISIKKGLYWKNETKGFRYYHPQSVKKFTEKEFNFILDRNNARKNVAEKFGITIHQVKRLRKTKKNIIIR